jgi:IS1 family transposase
MLLRDKEANRLTLPLGRRSESTALKHPRLIYGTTEQVETALRMSPVSHTITTYGVERQNLTVHQHARRMGRKVNAFSKDSNSLEEQLTLRLRTIISLSPIVACGNA